MTESEWLECPDPTPMLEFMSGMASERKLRLFACACYRRMIDWLEDFQLDLRVVEIGERIADGLASPKEFASARIRARFDDLGEEDSLLAAIGADCTAGVCAAVRGAFGQPLGRQWKPLDKMEYESWCGFHFHCIIGNPFRPVVLDPAWLTATVTGLATAAYNERGVPFDENDPERGLEIGEIDQLRLAVLADALEEAGCTNADILNHLRGPGHMSEDAGRSTSSWGRSDFRRGQSA